MKDLKEFIKESAASVSFDAWSYDGESLADVVDYYTGEATDGMNPKVDSKWYDYIAAAADTILDGDSGAYVMTVTIDGRSLTCVFLEEAPAFIANSQKDADYVIKHLPKVDLDQAVHDWAVDACLIEDYDDEDSED